MINQNLIINLNLNLFNIKKLLNIMVNRNMLKEQLKNAWKENRK